VAGRKIQAGSSQAAARRPCWDRPYALGQESLPGAAVLERRSAQGPAVEVTEAATPSWSLAALAVARAAQQMPPRWQRPLARSAQEAPSPAAARTPCCDPPDASAWQPGAAPAQLARREEAQQRLAEAEAQRASAEAEAQQRLVQAEAQQAEAVQQQLSQPWPQPARAASSLAVARRPCSDRRVAPVQRRQPEPAAAVLEQLLAQVPASAQVQAAVAPQRLRRRQAQPVPAASNPVGARTPCSDRRVAPVQQRQSEPVLAEEAAAARPQRSVQAEVAAPAEAAVPALRRPAAVQALAAEARTARWSSRRA
jgi:hypothetical protein